MKNPPQSRAFSTKATGNYAGAILAFCLLALVAQGSRAQVITNQPLPFYEPFPTTYLENEQLGSGNGFGGTANGTSGFIWTFGNSVSSSCARTILAATLGYPNLVTDPTSRGLRSNGAGKNRAVRLTPQTNVTVYASCLLNIQTNGVGNRVFLALSASTSGTGPTVNAGVWLDAAGRLLISKNSATTPDTNTTSPLVLSNTYLVVLRYQVNPDSPDEVALWLNPAYMGNNANVPPPTLTTTNNANVSGINSVAFMEPSSAPVPLFFLDEIRVGTSWAEVTPTVCTAGAIFSVTGGGTGCGTTGFPVGLSGSEAGVDYWLMKGGVFTGLSLAGTGSSLNFGVFTDNGQYMVLGSNTTSSCVYYMAGAATVNFQPIPQIATQPLPVAVAVNGSCIFSVTVNSGAFTYQWRRYGTNLVDGGNISGSQTPTLTISPAGPADQASGANGYYVYVSGPCPPAASSTPASLTLQPAANLVWQGDGIGNVWDLALTPNWTNSAGAPAVFNYGDNVTFDDTSLNVNVTLTGGYLSASSVTVNTANNYTFAGTGSIAGPGALLMNGPGILTVNNVNSFSGGATLNNGTTVLNTYGGLGSGQIALAGGLLEIYPAGSATVGLSNDVNVVNDSTLQYDRTGTYGCVLFGRLLGAAGKTLTINHSPTGPDRMRIYNPGIVLDANLNLNASGIAFTPYHSSGSQVYNGVVSGPGSILQRGSATTILSGANTYSGGTTLTTGTIGFGANSVSALPPAIDSGPIGTMPLFLTFESPAASGSATVLAFGGPRTVGNPIQYGSATNSYTLIVGGTNDLTLSGAYTLSGLDGTGGTNRTIQVNNTASTVLSGVIDDAGLGCGLIKTGPGSLALNGANTYTGPTAVSNGTLRVNGQLAAGPVTVATNGVLGGNGTIGGPVTVLAGGTLAPGASIGTLTINNNLAFAGNLAVEVNKSASPSSDKVVVSGTLNNTGAGTVTVSNLGPGLTTNDTFTVFSKPLANGGALSVTGAGAIWTNKLAVDGTIAVLYPVSTAPANVSWSVSGSSLTLSWPADHLTWTLQSNAVSVANTAAWYAVPGSQNTTQMSFTVNRARTNVFYRLVLP